MLFQPLHPAKDHPQSANAIKSTSFTNNYCHICYRKFSVLKTLNRHIRTVHQRQTYQCCVCASWFKRKDVRDRHEAEQHGKKSGSVGCVHCGNDIRTRALADHLKTQKCLEARLDRRYSQRKDEILRRHCDGESVFLGLPKGSVLEPILLCAYLYIQSEPYRDSNWSFYHIDEQRGFLQFRPTKAATKGILELQGLAMLAIAYRLKSRIVDKNLSAAISAFSASNRIINGPESSVVHEQALRSLRNSSKRAVSQDIAAALALQKALEEAGLADALYNQSLRPIYSNDWDLDILFTIDTSTKATWIRRNRLRTTFYPALSQDSEAQPLGRNGVRSIHWQTEAEFLPITVIHRNQSIEPAWSRGDDIFVRPWRPRTLRAVSGVAGF